MCTYVFFVSFFIYLAIHFARLNCLRLYRYTTDKNGFHATVLTNELEPSKARNSRDLAAQASVISAAETLLKGAAVFLRDVTSDPSGDGIYIQKMF